MMPSRFFADRTGRGVRVAVIDSGIHGAHPHVGGVAGGLCILEDGTESGEYVDRLGHGTAVAAAIREKAPDVELVAVKIFDRSLAADAGVLVRAIEAATRQGARVVNLSLGTTNAEHRPALRDAARQARARGAFIVSAREEGGAVWLPGSLPDVLPVLVDWECPRDEYRIVRRTGDAVLFRASGYPRDIPGVPRARNLKGISFAVANLSGFVARALEGRPDAEFDAVIAALEHAAAMVSSRPD